jgi:hypothetical protein
MAVSLSQEELPYQTLLSVLTLPHVERDARGKRHAPGNGISRGVKPADNVRPTQSEGKEGLPLRPMLTKETFV